MRQQQLLRNFLQAQLEDADEPWKLAHAMLALGKDVRLKDGADPIKEIFARHSYWEKVNGVDVVSLTNLLTPGPRKPS